MSGIHERSWKRPLSSLGYRSASALLSVHERRMKSISHTNIDTITRQYCLVDGIRVFRSHVRGVIYKTRQNGIDALLHTLLLIDSIFKYSTVISWEIFVDLRPSWIHDYYRRRVFSILFIVM